MKNRLTTQIPNNPHKSPVGAGLLAKAVYQSTSMLNDKTPSRASPLPHLDLCYFWRAVVSGNRAMFVAFSDPKYSQSPYSRTVVIGE